MGILLNPENINFQEALNSEIYIDKTELISNTNKILRTEQKYLCVSRPRRFGKSMAANMLAAYYSRGCDSKEMFSNYKIAKADSFEKHLNKYNVIHINMVEYMTDNDSIEEMISELNKAILFEIVNEFPDVNYYDKTKLIRSLKDVFAAKRISFVFIIDEWDCIFRKHKEDIDAQTIYLDFLRNLLKNQSYVALAYMTGILPIKKYGEHSAINMFTEISMTNAREFAEFTGFTESEVKELCTQYDMSFDETKRWYDGYNLKGISIYNPRSVVMSMTGHDFDNYWTSTETYEALKVYIQMNFDGLRDTVVRLLAGEKQVIDTTTFTNDMVTFNTKDDVLTLLVHLGYLTYNFDTKEVSIPNYEISEQFASTIKVMGWSEVANSLKISDELLKATLNGNEEKVAELIEKAHQDNTSILKYNDENSLSCVLSLAYYSARKSYTVERELPAGKGFADLVFKPRKNCHSPALIVELKYDKSADTAIEQIKNKQYTECLRDYSGEILLVGINYDKESKNHSCKIEKIKK
ncbi:MAG: ATP-binding protein [Ruminococcus sp.]|nr:ATP-binding protein [Ruminococcus sp.]